MPPLKKPRKRRAAAFTYYVRRACQLALCLLLLPYALVVIYLFVPPPSTSMIADILTLQDVRRGWVPLSKISPSLVAAVVTSEDGAFCDHWGVDFRQLGKSIEKAHARDKPVVATSTITMQTVKNLFLWSERSWVRKLLEIPLTFWMELSWPKWRILEVYLNIVQWGPGVYGAEAAAKYHFGVSARNLTRYQSTLLATSLPNPILRVASHPGPAQQELAAQLSVRLQTAAADMSCLK